MPVAISGWPDPKVLAIGAGVVPIVPFVPLVPAPAGSLKLSRRRTVFGPGAGVLMKAPGIGRMGVTGFMTAVMLGLVNPRHDQGRTVSWRFAVSRVSAEVATTAKSEVGKPEDAPPRLVHPELTSSCSSFARAIAPSKRRGNPVGKLAIGSARLLR